MPGPPIAEPERRPLLRNLVRAALFTALVLTGAVGCGSSDSAPDPGAAGARRQAQEKLRDYGLAKAEASCIVDELGADTVVEAPDVEALVAGKAYRDAARACRNGG